MCFVDPPPPSPPPPPLSGGLVWTGMVAMWVKVGAVGGGLSGAVCLAGPIAWAPPTEALAGRMSRPQATAAQPTADSARKACECRPDMSNRVLKSGILLDHRNPKPSHRRRMEVGDAR